MSHYGSIYVGYAAALLAWVVIWRSFPAFWPAGEPYRFERPWREIAYALVAALGVIAIGQLYVHGIRLPRSGPLGPVLESINQALIFAPMVVLLFVRKHGPETAWIKTDRVGWRLLAGVALAFFALMVYTLVRDGADPIWRVWPRIYRYDNLALAVQVFLEDFTIAVLAVRLSAVIGTRGAILAVAVLFAAGHIPTMISEGASLSELGSLAADAALGVAIVAVALRSRDIWWFWCVHFAMDMTQFERVSGVGN